ncbi:hypothetical protein SPW_7372 [Streptomyces sp. W007]|nr:hypothetical protein SPW_7372 [Streptomyces sp. W007]
MSADNAREPPPAFDEGSRVVLYFLARSASTVFLHFGHSGFAPNP